MKEFVKVTAVAQRIDVLVEKMRNKKPVLGQWRYPEYDDTLWKFLKLNEEYDRLWKKIEKKL
jgi:hypothetical protein